MSQDQHSVPVFLQKGWVIPGAGEVPYATMVPHRGMFHAGSKGPKGLNYVIDQWTIFHDGSPSYEIETGFTVIDTAAAPLIKRMRQQKGSLLISQAEKQIAWDFMKSLIMREPEEIKALKDDVEQQFISQLEGKEVFQETSKKQGVPVSQIAESLMGCPLSNIGTSLIPDAFHGGAWEKRSRGLELMMINYLPGDVNFLLGDRPVITLDFANKDNHRAYILPISRNALLVLTNHEEFAHAIRRARPPRLSKLINKFQVGRAKKNVIGDVKKHAPLLAKKCSGNMDNDPLLKLRSDSATAQFTADMEIAPAR